MMYLGARELSETYGTNRPLTFERLSIFFKKIFVLERTKYKISESEEDRMLFYHTEEDNVAGILLTEELSKV